MNHIAFVVHSLDRFAGGVENRASELILNLKNFKKDIIIFKNIINLPYTGSIKLIPLIQIPKLLLKKKTLLSCLVGFYIFFIRVYYLRQIIKKEKYQTILAFDDYFGLMTILATLGFKIKVIVSVRNYWEIMYNKKKCIHLLPKFVYTKIYPYLIKKRKCILHTVSYCLADEIKKKYNIENIKTIYNFFDFEKIKKLAQEEINFKFPFFINIGHLNEQKNHIDLIETFYILKNKYKIKEKLIIIGDGDKKTILEKKIKNLKLENEVFLLGKQKNPYKYLKRAKIFISTSLYEGLPSVFIESHILNIPIVTYDFKCGAKELSCFITKPNPNNLAYKVFEVLNDKNLQQKSIAFGKKIIHNKLNKKYLLNEWKEILSV